ncbi:MAG: FKBP-type peptidyl-prolyl cis-trans isomerase [Ekhidna sp.]|nr:FKBP-type peptidyl-prolyl cis-trans isomerase [Ekhidna sp.]
MVRNQIEQLGIDIEKIENYLLNNGIEAQVFPGGIRYQVIDEGTGVSPTLTDEITIKYTGSYLSDEVFQEEETITLESLQAAGVIEAWTTMIPTMKEGGRLIMYAPSGTCHGVFGNGVIPPNTNLIFDIELISVN